MLKTFVVCMLAFTLGLSHFSKAEDILLDPLPGALDDGTEFMVYFVYAGGKFRISLNPNWDKKDLKDLKEGPKAQTTYTMISSKSCVMKDSECAALTEADEIAARRVLGRYLSSVPNNDLLPNY